MMQLYLVSDFFFRSFSIMKTYNLKFKYIMNLKVVHADLALFCFSLLPSIYENVTVSDRCFALCKGKVRV